MGQYGERYDQTERSMTRRNSTKAVSAPLLVATFAVAVMPVPNASAFERRNVVCDLEDLTRKISLRVDPEAGYVCDVLYEKPDEGDTREVLWSARNSVDYCEPRFVGLVEQLAERGWTCDYADEPVDSADRPAIGAAKMDRQDDDETTSEGTRGKFRDWCVADVASGENIDGGGSVKGYCDCVARGMDSHGLSEEDAQLIFDGLSSLNTDGESESADIGKRLNTLAANYESVVEFCR